MLLPSSQKILRFIIFTVYISCGCLLSASDSAQTFRAEPVTLPSGRILVAPHPESVVVVSRVWLIIKGECGDLKLNGVPKKWNDRFSGDVHVATLGLEIGMVTLEIGEDKYRFVFGQNEVDHAGPKEWSVYRMHNMKPGINPCKECHDCQRNDDKKILVGNLNPPDKACFHCHETELLTKQHINTILENNWLQNCKDCHFIHMSPHKYLLRKPRTEYLKPGTE
ncbi:MAG: hypothetical protein Q4C96_06420 [Planctomycetia bacterium]|nr:hypothetical protein [Planctomycetia bacterium]